MNPNAHVTLHYRISLADSGADVVSTFGGRPATLQLGIGQLAEPLEDCLRMVGEGESRCFDLEPERAFGPRNPDLLQWVARSMLDQHGGGASTYDPGDLVEFPTPDGGRFAGVLKELTDDSALFDFNHPLAGKRVRFEVQIIAIL